MSEVLSYAQNELKTVSKTANGTHLKASDVRAISAKAYQMVKGQPQDHIFTICEELLDQRDWSLGVIAYDFAYRLRKEYSLSTFSIFERWLERYVRDWNDCDDFCTHAFGELLCQYPDLISQSFLWTEHEEFWMRRAAAVVLIVPIKKGLINSLSAFRVADQLMQDEHDLVRKGYGWMLKVLSVKNPEAVFNYLQKNQAIMPRVAYRYALEKLSSEQKNQLMA